MAIAEAGEKYGLSAIGNYDAALWAAERNLK
jgi:hypothetical protein